MSHGITRALTDLALSVKAMTSEVQGLRADTAALAEEVREHRQAVAANSEVLTRVAAAPEGLARIAEAFSEGLARIAEALDPEDRGRVEINVGPITEQT